MDFQERTWLRPTSFWKICECQSDPNVNRLLEKFKYWSLLLEIWNYNYRA